MKQPMVRLNYQSIEQLIKWLSHQSIKQLTINSFFHLNFRLISQLNPICLAKKSPFQHELSTHNLCVSIQIAITKVSENREEVIRLNRSILRPVLFSFQSPCDSFFVVILQFCFSSCLPESALTLKAFQLEYLVKFLLSTFRLKSFVT